MDVNNPTGRSGLVAIDKRGCRAFFLDSESFEAIDEVPLPARPHEVAISADHRLAYVSIYGNGIYGNNTLHDCHAARWVQAVCGERRRPVHLGYGFI